MKSLPDIYSLNTSLVSNKVNKILVVGCGGTGAYTIAFLSRIISTITNKTIELYIADGDVVEQKNLLRQHFVAQDINKNKADVLAERYSSAFGITINSIGSEIKSEQDLKSIFGSFDVPLVIGCVDNNASRKVISSFCNDNNRVTFWIDSGNEETNGQVVLGVNCNNYNSNFLSPFYQYSGLTKNTGLLSLPNVFEIYPEMALDESKFNSDLSCAERSISSPQNMMTNVTAATLITNYAQKILFGEMIKSHAVSFTINNVFSTRLNTIENLLLVDEKRRNANEVNFYKQFENKEIENATTC